MHAMIIFRFLHFSHAHERKIEIYCIFIIVREENVAFTFITIWMKKNKKKIKYQYILRKDLIRVYENYKTPCIKFQSHNKLLSYYFVWLIPPSYETATLHTMKFDNGLKVIPPCSIFILNKKSSKKQKFFYCIVFTKIPALPSRPSTKFTKKKTQFKNCVITLHIHCKSSSSQLDSFAAKILN